MCSQVISVNNHHFAIVFPTCFPKLSATSMHIEASPCRSRRPVLLISRRNAAACWASAGAQRSVSAEDSSVMGSSPQRRMPVTTRIVTLPETNSNSPLKMGLNAPKGNDHIPTIHFQVRAVNLREGTCLLGNPYKQTLICNCS